MIPHSSKKLVLDSWSILAYLGGEPCSQQVADLITDAHSKGSGLRMSVLNVGEVWYILAREESIEQAESAIMDLESLGIEFVDADWSLTRDAARLKSQHRMSYADCFAAALTKADGATLVTGDNEFKQVEDEVHIMWLR
jgi:predicted nucleic acid-binding protein